MTTKKPKKKPKKKRLVIGKDFDVWMVKNKYTRRIGGPAFLTRGISIPWGKWVRVKFVEVKPK